MAKKYSGTVRIPDFDWLGAAQEILILGAACFLFGVESGHCAPGLNDDLLLGNGTLAEVKYEELIAAGQNLAIEKENKVRGERAETLLGKIFEGSRMADLPDLLVYYRKADPKHPTVVLMKDKKSVNYLERESKLWVVVVSEVDFQALRNISCDKGADKSPDCDGCSIDAASLSSTQVSFTVKLEELSLLKEESTLEAVGKAFASVFALTPPSEKMVAADQCRRVRLTRMGHVSGGELYWSIVSFQLKEESLDRVSIHPHHSDALPGTYYKFANIKPAWIGASLGFGGAGFAFKSSRYLFASQAYVSAHVFLPWISEPSPLLGRRCLAAFGAIPISESSFKTLSGLDGIALGLRWSPLSGSKGDLSRLGLLVGCARRKAWPDGAIVVGEARKWKPFIGLDYRL